jgi:transcriptional regulator with XRE-family HTH domain
MTEDAPTEPVCALPPDQFAVHFGSALRRRRAQLYLTVPLVEQRAGLEPETLLAIERGRYSLSLHEAARLVTALSCSLDGLLREPPIFVPPDIMELQHLLAALHPTLQTPLVRLLHTMVERQAS